MLLSPATTAGFFSTSRLRAQPKGGLAKRETRKIVRRQGCRSYVPARFDSSPFGQSKVQGCTLDQATGAMALVTFPERKVTRPPGRNPVSNNPGPDRNAPAGLRLFTRYGRLLATLSCISMNSISEILEIFRSEFSPLLGKFTVHDLPLDAARDTKDAAVSRPGAYVYWNPEHGAIKVGKSQSNARKRALQHIDDNTKNERLQMSTLADDITCHLLLFTVPRDRDIHWILSLECFLEWRLKPVIPFRQEWVMQPNEALRPTVKPLRGSPVAELQR